MTIRIAPKAPLQPKWLEAGERTLSYRTAGAGPLALLLHGAGESHAAFQTLADALAATHRVLVPDLPGHGDTLPLPAVERRTRAATVALLARLLEIEGDPAHVVGHGLGGALALSLAVARPAEVLSLTLIEPAAFELLRRSGDPAWAEIDALAQRQRALLQLGDLPWCAGVYDRYWIGEEGWQPLPAAQRAAFAGVRAQVEAWDAVYHEAGELEPLRRVGVPALLLQSTGTREPVRRVTTLLDGALRNSRVATFAAASPLAPRTHAARIVPAVLEHLARQDDRRAPARSHAA